MRKHIPNIITLLNLLSGCVAVIFAVGNQLSMAAVFVFLGIFFDFFDGLAARALNVKSELGLQLDSLADMVTSGLVPGIIMFQLLNRIEEWHINLEPTLKIQAVEVTSYLPFLGFLITLAAAYRLAKFNIDENQTTSFIGLPTPANALLILSLPLILEYQNSELIHELILNKWFLIGLTLLSAFMMNANIPLFALKFKHLGFKGNEVRYFFILISVLLLIFLKFLAIPIIILVYVLFSAINTKVVKEH